MKEKPQAAAERPHKTKRPYSTPAFQFERVFETSALSCGKVSSTQSTCTPVTNRKNS